MVFEVELWRSVGSTSRRGGRRSCGGRGRGDLLRQTRRRARPRPRGSRRASTFSGCRAVRAQHTRPSSPCASTRSARVSRRHAAVTCARPRGLHVRRHPCRGRAGRTQAHGRLSRGEPRDRGDEPSEGLRAGTAGALRGGPRAPGRVRPIVRRDGQSPHARCERARVEHHRASLRRHADRGRGVATLCARARGPGRARIPLPPRSPISAVALHAAGEPDEAERAAFAAEEMSAPDDFINFAVIRSARALVLADRGELEEAEELARSAVEYAFRTDFPLTRADALAALARVLRRADREEEADEFAGSGRRALRGQRRRRLRQPSVRPRRCERVGDRAGPPTVPGPAHCRIRGFGRYERKKNLAMVAQVRPKLEALRLKMPT